MMSFTLTTRLLVNIISNMQVRGGIFLVKWFAQRPRQWLTPIVAQQILLTDLTGDGRLSIYTY